ncbi:hypothetical protein [Streptomyces sp. NPDC059071]|uniref:hypothetical protein n=1 Tax=unclassified Streptomyces TaxID=2593676 RepID=UPI003647DECE
MLDAPDRCQVVELLAVLTYHIEHSPPRPAARAALGTLRPTLLGLVTGAHPGVRTMAAWLLGILGRGDDAPAVTARTVAALRSGLAEDFDPSARSSRLRALAALVPLDLCDDDPGHEELRHPVALVRLAAAERVYPPGSVRRALLVAGRLRPGCRPGACSGDGAGLAEIAVER